MECKVITKIPYKDNHCTTIFISRFALGNEQTEWMKEEERTISEMKDYLLGSSNVPLYHSCVECVVFYRRICTRMPPNKNGFSIMLQFNIIYYVFLWEELFSWLNKSTNSILCSLCSFFVFFSLSIITEKYKNNKNTLKQLMSVLLKYRYTVYP